MFFHMDLIKKFKSYIWSERSITIVVIVINVRGIEDNKNEKNRWLYMDKVNLTKILIS